jgi:hypothetical protein
LTESYEAEYVSGGNPDKLLRASVKETGHRISGRRVREFASANSRTHHIRRQDKKEPDYNPGIPRGKAKKE